MIVKLPSRIGSAFIDLVSLAAASLIVSIPNLFLNLMGDMPSNPQENNSSSVYEAIIFFSIFLNKDIFFGRSVGKFITGFRVVSIKSGNPASPIQCALRNLFLLLWPLEGMFLIFSPERRFGDIVAGTTVQESTVIIHKRKPQFIQRIISVVSSFVIIYILFTFIDSLGIMN